MTYNWETVESSAVRALCFVERGTIPARSDPLVGESYGEAYVCFHSGDVYRYFPVLECAYCTLLTADSIGRDLYHVLVPGTGMKVGELPDDTTTRSEDG